MTRRLLLPVACFLLGALVCWHYLAWRVYVAEGIRDVYMLAAGEAQMKCADPQPGKWPR